MMEDVFTDQRFQMGVDHVNSTFEKVKAPVVTARCAEGKKPDLLMLDPVLEQAKALLKSMSQSTAEISHAMKPFGTPDKSKKRQKDDMIQNIPHVKVPRQPCLKEKLQGNKKPLALRNGPVTFSHSTAHNGIDHASVQGRLTHAAQDEVILNLEPIPLVRQGPQISWKSAPYYTKVHKKPIPQKNCLSDHSTFSDGTDSAVKRIQEWHTKHLKKLRHKNSVNAATSRLKAIAVMKEAFNKFPLPSMDSPSGGFEKPSDSLQFHCDIASAKQRTKYFTVSNRYYQYLNCPKRAKHEAFKIVFRAHVLIDSVPNLPEDNTLYPKCFISWPSGKIPLPGYKPANIVQNIQRLATSKKKKRTYRVAKAKPKFNSAPTRNFPQSQCRKPPWATKKPLQQKRFFPVMWDPAGEKFMPQRQQTITRTMLNGQWFRIVSPSAKNHPHVPEMRKKFGVSGAPLRASVASLGSQPYPKSLPPPFKLQQNIREINVVFKCKTTPEPYWFEKWEDYANVCVLYQVRKVMAATAMECGFVEGGPSHATKSSQFSEGQVPATLEGHVKPEGAEKAIERAVSNSLILISTQAEVIFARWSSRLPNAKEIDQSFNNAERLSTSKSVKDICSQWLHTCKSGVVENTPERQTRSSCPVSDEQSLKTLKAWLYDTASDEEDSSPPMSNFGMERYTEDQSCAMSTHMDSKSSVNNGSMASTPRLYGGIGHWKSKPDGNEQHREMRRSMSGVRSLKRDVCTIQRDTKILPQPSYCVRYRMCFCTFSCACCAKVGLMVKPDTPNLCVDQSCCHLAQSKVNCEATNPAVHDESLAEYDLVHDNNFYNLSGKSDTHTIVRGSSNISKSPSKWDVRRRKSLSDSFATGGFAKYGLERHRSYDRGNAESSNFFRRGSLQLVKKIGGTEIYYKWVIRRYSAPISDSLRVDTEVKNAEVAHRQAIVREILVRDPQKFSFLSETALKVENPEKTEVMPTPKNNPGIFALGTIGRGGSVLSVENNSEMIVQQGVKGSRQVVSGVPARSNMRECLYRADKGLCAALAKNEFSAFVTHNLKIVESGVKATVKKITAAPLSAQNSHETYVDLSRACSVSNAFGDNSLQSGGHACRLTGAGDSGCKRSRTEFAKQSLVDGLDEESSGDAAEKEAMGNRLPKPKLLDGLAMLVQSTLVNGVGFLHDAVDDLRAAGCELTDMGRETRLNCKQRIGSDLVSTEFHGEVTTHKPGSKESLYSGFSCIELHKKCTSNDKPERCSITPVPVKIANADVGQTAKNKSIRSNDAERKATTMRLRSVNERHLMHECRPPARTEIISSQNVAKISPKIEKSAYDHELPKAEDITAPAAENVKVQTDNDLSKKGTVSKQINLKQHHGKSDCSFVEEKDLSDATQGERSTTKTERDERQGTAPAGADIDLPVETRSSRRLRSKVGNKRSRYETDYIADWPKANKKPRKVLPSRDYDNDEFWQFYRDREKSVYAKNLILQQKYIKLLKSKGIRAAYLPVLVNQFTSVICGSSTPVNSELPTVPDDGQMPFMKRLVKTRKTTPALPKVSDDQCPYCGFSFVSRNKRFSEAHLARHGKRHTILTVPRPLRKRKKMKATRKDIPLKKSKLNNGKTAIAAYSPRKEEPTSKTKDGCVVFQDSSSRSCDLLTKLKPLPRPAHLSMGHRKQTARKSFSITSTLPKDVLIAALECNMRAQSGLSSEKTQPAASNLKRGDQTFDPSVDRAAHKSPSNFKVESAAMVHQYFPHSARKTLTGLPITYNYLHNSLMQNVSPSKSFR